MLTDLKGIPTPTLPHISSPSTLTLTLMVTLIHANLTGELAVAADKSEEVILTLTLTGHDPNPPPL